MISKLLAAAAIAAVAAPLSCEAKTVAFEFETATIDVTGKATLSDVVNAAGGYDVEFDLGLGRLARRQRGDLGARQQSEPALG